MSNDTIPLRLMVIFDNFGPYHVARLQALDSLCDLLAVQVYGSSHEYSWSTPELGQLRCFTLDERSRAQVDPLSSLVQLIELKRPDVVFIPGWSSKVALYALSCSRRLGIPCVLMSDSQANDSDRVTFVEWVKAQIVRRYSGALVAGTPHAEYAINLGVPAHRIRLGYDVVDNQYFWEGAQAAREDETSWRSRLALTKPFFLTSSRFIERKNHLRLIDAYAGYRKNVGEDAWDLVLLGDGPMRPAIEAAIARLALKESVHLLGFRQYDEIAVYMGLAEALILPSTSEQWGLVVNEAMAAGLPVLVSNRCGSSIDLVIEGKTGYTFDPFDVEELVGLMLRFSSMPLESRKILGLGSQRKVADFSLASFAVGAKELAEAIVGTSQSSVLDYLLLRFLATTRRHR